MGRVLVGTASWTDRSLLESGWYPPTATTPEERLDHYAANFPLVEVDATYYHPPALRTAELWRDRTPDDFTFNIKAFSLLTQHPTRVRSLYKTCAPACAPPRARSTCATSGPRSRRRSGSGSCPHCGRCTKRASSARDPLPVPAVRPPREVLALDVDELDLRNRRARVRRKGGAVEVIVWCTPTARLLPRLLDGRRTGPVFLTDRRARLGLPPGDLDDSARW